RDDIARLLCGEVEIIEREKRYLHADGHHIWVRLRVSRLQDSDGEAAQMIVQIEDISARKRAAEQSRRRARQQSLLAELGALALGGESVERVCEVLVDAAASGLGVSHARLLRVQGDGPARQVAQRGWPTAGV